MAFTIIFIPIEVVWANLWAADASADRRVPDFITCASICWFKAHTLAGLDIEHLAFTTLIECGSWVAFALAVVSREVLSETALSLFAKTSAFVSVEVVTSWANLWSALATARVSVEVVHGRLITFLLCASAIARIPVEKLALWALSWDTSTARACCVIEVTAWAVVSCNAFAFAFSQVVLVSFWASLRFKNASTVFTVPELVPRVYIWALSVVHTLTLATIEVPNIVLHALLLFADACAGHNIKDLVFTAVLGKVSACAVVRVIRLGCAVNILTISADWKDLARLQTEHGSCN